MDLSRLVQEYLEDLQIEKGRSRLTIVKYDLYLRRFLDWTHCASPADITQDIIRRFRLRLAQKIINHPGKGKVGEALSRGCQNGHLIAVRGFLRYLTKRDIASLAPDKIDLARVPERSVNFLDAEELENLLNAPFQKFGQKPLAVRDNAILEMLFSTGLRVSELANLQKGQIHNRSDEISVRGKGGKTRVVFISSRARTALQKYLLLRNDDCPLLFIRWDKGRGTLNKTQKALSSRSIERLVKSYVAYCGLGKKITPHTLRHSFATDLLQNGADLRSVQALLGHSSIMTTQIYTHVTDQHLADIHKAFHSKRRKK
ncbi:MAG: hypothetical protein US76_01210 [Parcubacteria group bacterium GW2011_GWA2_38_13b]|nr:MAG: hypothetical protein US76_01210 [Parcubacteria group bacterium GW2011_GWA2_38_13b]